MNAILLAILLAFSICAYADSAGSTAAIELDHSSVRIKLDRASSTVVVERSGSVVQTINLEPGQGGYGEPAVLDYNFDGYADIGVPGDSGNVERFTNVFLYSRTSKKYELSKNLSLVPCLGVDKRKRRVLGECFHASACENWTEVYSVQGKDTLNLVEKRGFSCDPATNTNFRFVEKYRNGRLVSNSVVNLK